MTYKICRLCGLSLPNNRLYFKRLVNKDGTERLVDVCRSCAEYNRKTEDWQYGKLLCHVCHNYLEIEQFDISKNCKYRQFRDKRCKYCKYELSRKCLKSKTEKQKLYHILQSRLLSAKDRSKNKHIAFDLTLDDLYEVYYKLDGKCAISGITMTYDVLSGRTSTNISLDKIDPNNGYTKDNIHLVCTAVNEMKNDRSVEELKYFCQCILKEKVI